MARVSWFTARTRTINGAIILRNGVKPDFRDAGQRRRIHRLSFFRYDKTDEKAGLFEDLFSQ
jgi:hypothetical protein